MSQPAALRVLVVGGVAGGASFAARLRRLDEKAVIKVFERGPYVSFANCGLPYYIGGEIGERDDLLLADPELFRQRFNISIHTGCEVLSIDRQAKTVKIATSTSVASSNGSNPSSVVISEESYDYLLLSPGAQPIRPPMPGSDLPAVHVLRNITDSDNIKHWLTQHRHTNRAVIVGGGFIGVEMAENLVRLGRKVTLIERSAQLMPPFDPEMMSQLHQHLRDQGVELLLNTNVTGFHRPVADGTSGGAAISVNIMAQQHKQQQQEQTVDAQSVVVNSSIDADLVILAIGVRPDTTLAKQCGLELGGITGGVKVDKQMRTSDPSIFAVGDCVESMDLLTGESMVLALANPANRQARIAAAAICGRPAEFRGVQATAVCKAFQLVLALTGASEKRLKRQGRAYEKVYLHPNQHVGYFPGATRISLKLLFDPNTGRVLGAQAVGREGVEKRIDVTSMAIQGGLSVFDLEEAELCYAPQFGAAKDPINMAGMIAAACMRGDQPIVHWDQQDYRTDAACVLDVRSQAEYDRYHLEQSRLIPLPDLRRRLMAGETEEQLGLAKDQPVFVHCAVGQRGYYATRLLRHYGYNAFNYSGGVITEQMQTEAGQSKHKL